MRKLITPNLQILIKGFKSNCNKTILLLFLLMPFANNARAQCNPDVTPPTITCAGPVVVNSDAGICGANVTVPAPIVSDNCSVIGNALSFDGVNDIISGSDAGLPSGTSARTIESWVKWTSVNPLGIIFKYGNSASTRQPFALGVHSSGKVYFWGQSADVSGNTIINDGNWHHVAVTYNGTTTKLYVDGNLDASGTPTLNTQLTGTYYLGMDPFTGWRLNGSIDEVRVWNVERTQAQIQANMNTKLGAQTGLVRLFHFDQGSAGGNNTAITQVFDNSGNGYNGTLTNFAKTGATSNFVTGAPAINNLSYVNSFNNTTDASGIYPIGTTTITWTATDAAGLTATCTQNVTVNPPPPVNAGSNVSICPGGSTVLTATGGTNPYSWSPVGQPPLAIDGISGATLAVGLRKLKTGYNGFALRLRRSSDNSEMDFGFIGNNLDAAAIATWLGASSGFCTILYDQSGSGNNVTQPTSANQPLYVANGINGKPMLHFSTSMRMTNTTNFPSPFTVVYGARQNAAARNRVLSSPANNWLLGWWNGKKGQAYYEGWVSNNGNGAAADNNSYIYSGSSNGSTSQLYENGTLLFNNSGGVRGPNGIELNGVTNGNEVSDCDFLDVTVFSSVLSNNDRAVVENNIGSYYNIITTGVGIANGNYAMTVSPTSTTTYTVTAGPTGCATTSTVTVSVITTPPPVFTACPSNITAPMPVGTCAPIAVSYTATATGTPTPAITYAFTGATTGSGNGTGSGSLFNLGVTNVVLTANNGCIITTCSFSITVYDVTPPTITCGAPVVINNYPGACNANVTVPAPIVSDNCSVIGNALSFDGENDYVQMNDPNIGTSDFTIETWVKSNSFGKYIIETRTIEYSSSGKWFDIQINSSGKLLLELAANNSTLAFLTGNTTLVTGTWYHISIVRNSTTITFYVNGVFDASFNDPIIRDLTTGNNILRLGGWPENPVTWFNGILDEVRIWNVARTQTQIQASMNSELNAQTGLIGLYHFNQGIAGGNNAAITQATDNSGNGYNGTLTNFAKTGATSNFLTGAPAINNLSYVNSFNNTTYASGIYPIGTTTITWTATDAAGLTATCTQNVTVVDNQPPTVNCKPKTFSLSASGTASIVPADVYLSGSDNCGTVNLVSVTPNSFTCANLGANTVTLTVNDGNGNTTTCSATVTIQDIILPTITCPDNILVSNDPGVCGATITYNTPAGTDNCNATTYQTSGYASGELFPIGTTTNTFQVIDESGNSAFCSFDVTVTDSEAPTIICPNDVTVNTDPGLCSASGFSIGIPFNDDNCGVFSMGSDAPESFNVGTTVVTWTVGDAAGNTSACAMNVTVNDNELPTITNCPANFSSCNPVSWTLPTMSDNCSYTYTSTFSPGDNFPFGTTTVVYTITDASGNTASCSFKVLRLEDSVAPTKITSNRPFNNICKQENITLTLDGGSLGYLANWKWYSGSCGGTPVASNVTSITVAPGATTTYYVRAEGYCDTTACASITVIVSTGNPSGHLTIISAPLTGSVGDVDTVVAAPLAGAVFYRWNATGPVLFDGQPSPYESTSNSVAITYAGLPSTGISGWTIHVFAANACGRSNTANTRIRSATSAPTSLTGSTVACPDSTKNYTVSSIYGAASYQWTLNPSTAGTITGNGTQTVSVKFAVGFTQADLCVSGVTSFNLVGPSLCITIKNKTGAPGTISGDTLPCPADTVTYSIANVQGALSYEWTIPVGASIIGNANGNSVDVKFPTPTFSGSVCVRAYSGCGYSDYSCVNVSPGSPPAIPAITGRDTAVCDINGVEYSVVSASALYYDWTTPSGATISSGDGTNAILVDFSNSFGGGIISVTASNGCGSNSTTLSVTSEPITPAISGQATACIGDDMNYTASSTGATNFVWTINPLQGVIMPSSDPSEITVVWNTAGGTIYVTATNSCGSSAQVSLVVGSGCRSASAISDLLKMEATAYPNPTEGKFTLQYNSPLKADYRMQITDLLGRALQTETLKGIDGMNLHEVDLNSIAKGIYLLKMENHNNESVVIRIVVQ